MPHTIERSEKGSPWWIALEVVGWGGWGTSVYLGMHQDTGSKALRALAPVAGILPQLTDRMRARVPPSASVALSGHSSPSRW